LIDTNPTDFLGVSFPEANKYIELFPKTPEYEHDRTTLLLNELVSAYAFFDFNETSPSQLLFHSCAILTVSSFQIYLEKTHKTEEYFRVAQKMGELHETLGNHVEAGMCYLMQANTMEWKNRLLPAFESFPIETLYNRKTQLILKAVKCFSTGKYWEKGIELLKELRERFTEIKDWNRLSEISLLEASLWKELATKDRFFENYFLVEFAGKGYPPSLVVLYCNTHFS
jgi:hypothetical protein